MPIQIPNDLPAAGILQQENIFVMRKTRAETQHIRPLEIVLLNLMPTKIVTETQLSRLLGNTPLRVHLELMMVSTHRSKNTPQEHLLNFYKTFDELKDRKFDGMVITGAPVEQMPFEDVDYWPELCEIMDFSETNVYSTLHVCWGAQAGLYYHYGVHKELLPEKMFGVFEHRVTRPANPLVRGFDEVFYAPHSRIQHPSPLWLLLLSASLSDPYIPYMYLETYPIHLYWLYAPVGKFPKKQAVHIRQLFVDKASRSSLYIYYLLHNNLHKPPQAANYILLSFDSNPH